MKRVLAILAFLLPVAASAQSLPFPISQNTIWSVNQWISAWTSKADLASIASGSNFNAALPTQGVAVGANQSGNLVAFQEDVSGNLNVNCQAGCNSILPPGASSATNQLAIQGSVGAGTAATKSVLIGGVFNSSAPTLTNGQQAAAQFDSSGNLKVNIQSGGGTGGTASSFAAAFPASGTAIGAKNGSNMVNLVADASNFLEVNCATGCAGGTFNNNADGVATSATNGQTAAWLYAWNGSTWDRLEDDGSKNLKVNLATAVPAGTNLIGKVGIDQTTVGTTNAVSIADIGANAVVTGGVNGSLSVGGPTASGSSIAANPLTTGGRAQNAEATAVTNGQVVNAAFDLVGKQIVSPFANKENFLTGSTAGVTTATNTQLVAAQAAGIKIYLTGYSCANTGTNTSLLQITSGSGGSVLWTLINPAGGGVTGQIVPPVATAAATALYLTTATASTSQYCSITGFAGT